VEGRVVVVVVVFNLYCLDLNLICRSRCCST